VPFFVEPRKANQRPSRPVELAKLPLTAVAP